MCVMVGAYVASAVYISTSDMPRRTNFKLDPDTQLKAAQPIPAALLCWCPRTTPCRRAWPGVDDRLYSASSSPRPYAVPRPET